MAEPTSHDLATAFISQFQTKRTELESRIAGLLPGSSSSDINPLSLDLAALRKGLVDAINEGYLPPFDQRQLELQLSALEKSLESGRAAAAPTKKFAFKRKVVSGGAASTTASVTLATPSTLPASDAANKTSDITFSKRKNAYLGPHDIPGEQASSLASDLAITDLENCFVNMRSPPGSNASLTAVYIHDIRNCVVVLPEIRGSILVHDMENCFLLIGKCQQFRMHNSSNIDVLLSPSSNPVIEHCSLIRFGTSEPSTGDSAAGLPFQPQDFTHLRPTPSPNWEIMDRVRAQMLTSSPLLLSTDPLPSIHELLPRAAA